jgi:hypothetical protein
MAKKDRSRNGTGQRRERLKSHGVTEITSAKCASCDGSSAASCAVCVYLSLPCGVF